MYLLSNLEYFWDEENSFQLEDITHHVSNAVFSLYFLLMDRMIQVEKMSAIF